MELEPILIRAEALFLRFQRTVEAIDKKGNFPAPKVRKRLPHRPTSSDDVTSPPSSPMTPVTPLTSPPAAYFPHGADPNGPGARRGSSSPGAHASTSGADTGSSSTPTLGGAAGGHALGGSVDKWKSVDKGKAKRKSVEIQRARKDSNAGQGEEEEIEVERPKIISPELRGLMSRTVEVLPRKVVRREGEGLGRVRSR